MKEFEIVDQPGVDIFWPSVQSVEKQRVRMPELQKIDRSFSLRPALGEMSRLASNNNMSKSESDQEDNDDLNDNDWSYGAEKKTKKKKSDKNQNSPRRSKSIKHKNGELGSSVSSEPYKYNYNTGISYETLGPDEVRSLLTTQCGVISEHTKKMCTRSQRCPQHTDEQRRAVRVFLLGPSAPSLPDADAAVENDSFDIPDGQTLMSRLQWEDSP
ncbi:Ataxin-7-like protein 3 [Larimichthys crocea]|uniref:Ataxin-7-like protein 3 n=1 Tax=Larimichthys crocea TaxID=215358 RepID=A0A6G0HWA7_LARCR|nr:Ataxin-7-like protein 3 [Larimichthys crocea]